MNNINSSREKSFIKSLVPGYITSDKSSQIRLMHDLIIKTFKPYLNKGLALELGCEIGHMSEKIASLVDHLDIVDGAEEFIEQIKKKNLRNVNYYVSLFEEFEPKIKYDYIFASHILEHLLDVSVVLNMARVALKPPGYLFVAVPNARALSRQLARHMELIDSLYSLTPNDKRGGHRRIYDRVSLNRDLESAGFEIISQGGILFKPLADFQMDKLIDLGILGEAQCEGLYKLGHEYPDMCSDIYAVARLKS